MEFHKQSILISCSMPFYRCSPLVCYYQFRVTLCLSVLPSNFAVEDNIFGCNCIGLQIVQMDDSLVCLKLRSRCVVMHVCDYSDMFVTAQTCLWLLRHVCDCSDMFVTVQTCFWLLRHVFDRSEIFLTKLVLKL